MRRFLVRALAVVVGLLVFLIMVTYASLRRSLPAVSGTTSVTGISAPIDIIRDADAIPHIFAATRLDAMFGLGYAHAQDRLWQMEFQRRIGFGRCCARDSDLRAQRRERTPDRRANTTGTTADHCHVADKKIGAETACAHCTDRFRNAATSAWVGSGSTAP